MDKEKRLKNLNKEIKSCKKCPLWKTKANNVPEGGQLIYLDLIK